MVTPIRIYAIIMMSLILIFSFVHLGVSIGIISKNRSFGDMFRPEIGLSAFNIVISFLGIVVGALGLFCILTNQEVLNKIIIIISGILGIFALVSLITALIINSKSVSYVSTRFFNNMNQYSTSSDARNIIDRIQTSYKCCGETMWLDWSRVQSGTTTVTTTTFTSITTITPTLVTTTTFTTIPTITPTLVTTTTSAAVTTTTLAVEISTMPPEVTTFFTSSGEGTTFFTSSEEGITSFTSSENGTASFTSAGNGTISFTSPEEGITSFTSSGESTASFVSSGESTASFVSSGEGSTSFNETGEGTTSFIQSGDNTTSMIPSAKDVRSMPQASSSVISSRIHLNSRRQIYPLDLLSDPSMFVIRRERQAIPTYINMISVSYSTQFSVPATCCINGRSSLNGSSQPTCSSTSQFYTNGCLTSIVKRANEQDMGIGIINCFMIVLAFVAIPCLLHAVSTADSHEKRIYENQLKNMRQFDAHLKNYPTIINTYH